MSHKLNPQSGLSMVELVVGLAIMGIVGLIFAVAYRSLSKGSAEISSTADMQRVVKSMGTQLESDLKRAGFGLGGGSAFNTLGAREISFNFKDLLGTSCAAGELATIRYSLAHNALARDLSCDGRTRPRKAIGAGMDSLGLTFRYLDNAGNVAASSAQVRTVEYALELTSGRGHGESRKKRASAGSVSIVNNG